MILDTHSSLKLLCCHMFIFVNHLSHLFRFGLLAITLVITTNALADCIKDFRGEIYCGAGQCTKDIKGTVWCSRHYSGDAVRLTDGSVVCGVGQCREGSDGRAYCSSEIGGHVLEDGRGRVRCYGSCELGTLDNCESSRADVAIGE